MTASHTGSAADPTVLYAIDDAVGILTLNRPHALNSFTRQSVKAPHARCTRNSMRNATCRLPRGAATITWKA